ncbi:hypothetical protein ACN28S_56750 [Cystobacter fuscus]
MRRLFLAVSTLALLAAACRSAPQPTPEPTPSSAPGPEAPATPSTDPEAFRDQPPTAGPAPELVLPRFEQAVLDNGLTVLVSTRKELPLVYVGIAFAAGSATDPQGKWGPADLTYKMILEGAAGKDTLALDRPSRTWACRPR